MRDKWKVQKRPKPGTPPEIKNIDPHAHPTTLTLYAYDALDLQTHTHFKEMDASKNIWISVVGFENLALISELGKKYNLHPLALEDVLHNYQRPKLEKYDDALFLTTQLFQKTEKLFSEQLSFFVFKNVLISFQEKQEDDFVSVVESLKQNKNNLRAKGVDSLLYALLDLTVDRVFPLLEHSGERLDHLESKIFNAPQKKHLHELHEIKSDLISIKRFIWAQKDALTPLIRDDLPQIKSETKVYFRDIFDHCTQANDLLENFREMSMSLLEVYLSSLSNKMNEVMKTLTIISTLFMPLTFIVGVYGMNFHTAHPLNMPELRWPYGYPFVMGIMLLIALAMLWIFKKRGWILQKQTEPLK